MALGWPQFVFAGDRNGTPTSGNPPGSATLQPLDAFDLANFPDMVAGDDSLSCVVPFSRAGNLILIKATADTTEGNFILDTGAQSLVLNITYFRDYPASTLPASERSGITGTAGPVLRTFVKKFTIGDLTYLKSRADLVNLGHIENTKGVKILGLLGMDLFRQCEMIIDYERSLIYFHRIGRKELKTYRNAQLADSSLSVNTIPFDLKDNRIIIHSDLVGKKVDFVVDSGAETNLLDSRLPNKIFENVTITGRVMLTGTGNRKTEALRGDLKNIMFGTLSIDNLPILVTNLEKTCFSYDGCINGVLGFDFLTVNSSKIGFNFVRREMYIFK